MIHDLLDALKDGLRIQNLDPSEPVALPTGVTAESLERFLPFPQRERGSVTFQKLGSLLDYAERHHEQGATAIFADADGHHVCAVLNWHAPATDVSSTAGWGDHSLIYSMKFTREYQDWTGIAGRSLTQTQFAEFLEEHLDNIQKPEPAALLEAVSRLSGKRNISFESSKRLDNGDVSIEWKEDTQTSNGAFPSRFMIQIPIYRGAEKATTFEINALLRYRINDGKLAFEVKLLHVDAIRDLAFDQVLSEINRTVASWEDKETPVYIGSITKKP
jgi:uncharacterized protein YfdQ (DUF2303 family)